MSIRKGLKNATDRPEASALTESSERDRFGMINLELAAAVLSRMPARVHARWSYYERREIQILRFIVGTTNWTILEEFYEIFLPGTRLLA
jgi:hypothetical protein